MFKSGYFHRDFIDATCKKYNLDMTIAFETNLLPMILSIDKARVRDHMHFLVWLQSMKTML